MAKCEDALIEATLTQLFETDKCFIFNIKWKSQENILLVKEMYEYVFKDSSGHGVSRRAKSKAAGRTVSS